MSVIQLTHDQGNGYITLQADYGKREFYVGVDMVGANRRVDPQALVDALAELFPDVKPSPPKPKVGDTVKANARTDWCEGTVLAVSGNYIWAKFPNKHLLPHTFISQNLTVIERGS